MKSKCILCSVIVMIISLLSVLAQASGEYVFEDVYTTQYSKELQKVDLDYWLQDKQNTALFAVNAMAMVQTHYYHEVNNRKEADHFSEFWAKAVENNGVIVGKTDKNVVAIFIAKDETAIIQYNPETNTWYYSRTIQEGLPNDLKLKKENKVDIDVFFSVLKAMMQ